MLTYTYNRLIIDGNNFIYRAFYTKRPSKELNGVNTTPIHQFLYMLKSVVERFLPKEIYITWDKKINTYGTNFRKKLSENTYKEQRIESSDTIKIFDYIDNYIQEFIDALGIITIYPYNLEGDDVICYLANLSADKTTLVISSDKDLLQLINKNVNVYLPNKDMIVSEENFEEFTTVPKTQYILYKSILGDISDNITGLDKYGPVRAKKLVNEWSTSDKLSSEQYSLIENNLKIIDLNYVQTAFPDEYNSYQEQLDNNTIEYSGDRLRKLFEEYQFYNFKRSIGEWTSLFDTKKVTTDLLSMFNM